MMSPKKCRTVRFGNTEIGGSQFTIIAGPCSVESEEHFLTTGQTVKKIGASIIRGGVFKMRTNPQSFQGLGSDGLSIAKRVRNQVGLPIVCEVTDPRQIGDMMEVVDVFQVGSRNMYNYSLLKELGRVNKPVMLKRGFSALIEEWVLAANYVLEGGNNQVILCERGIRSFDKITRNTLDLASVAYLKQNYEFPVIVDPSHGTGVRSLVTPMSLAAAAAGADGILVEVHPNPDQALSDGFQTLNFDEFDQLVKQLNPLLKVLNRHAGT